MEIDIEWSEFRSVLLYRMGFYDKKCAKESRFPVELYLVYYISDNGNIADLRHFSLSLYFSLLYRQYCFSGL